MSVLYLPCLESPDVLTRARAVLLWNVSFHELRKEDERLLPTEIANLGWDGLRDPLLNYIHLCTTGHLVQRYRRLHFSGEVRIIERVLVADAFHVGHPSRRSPFLKRSISYVFAPAGWDLSSERLNARERVIWNTHREVITETSLRARRAAAPGPDSDCSLSSTLTADEAVARCIIRAAPP